TTRSISVVIPVFNEARRIASTLAQVWRYFEASDAEILIVDDGSTDNTVQLARDFAKDRPRIRVLAEKHRGKAATVLTGLEQSVGELVVFMDADLATPLETWERCVEAIQDGASVAIASREGVGADRVAEPWYRHVMGRIFNGL